MIQPRITEHMVAKSNLFTAGESEAALSESSDPLEPLLYLSSVSFLFWSSERRLIVASLIGMMCKWLRIVTLLVLRFCTR